MTVSLKRSLAIGSAVLFAGLLSCAHHDRVIAAEHCFYKGAMYSEGAAACQAGTQYRCDNGDWAATGMACSDHPAVTAKNCEASGISYMTGSASCQAGAQFRCEDGAWRSIGIPCTLGDSPIKVVPSGRTCMFDDATVANGSTVCRSGLTQLCSDGAWVNLGTLCR
jgi:hypothetical protein